MDVVGANFFNFKQFFFFFCFFVFVFLRPTSSQGTCLFVKRFFTMKKKWGEVDKECCMVYLMGRFQTFGGLAMCVLPVFFRIRVWHGLKFLEIRTIYREAAGNFGCPLQIS
jgi:hypothetical protein